ncbi:T9SS type A sorting domain-containing protein [Dyadobacter sp. MSC1_007]|jgi:hypothetical protein|uniref:T9SS type A sorting domain-containing protein n=1 Tax=Dyadobacter sp. MSC1_007 TaxID=2909264 RepID=UPI002030C584|nr:T9SS type A sorting domain-containing protein [Dyadobacter sp. MSC1_007]
MKQLYTNPPGKGWISIAVSATLFLLGHRAQAQEGSQGNTTIFGGAQMTFFSNHNFVTGGGGAQPGVILTERAVGNFGVLNFAGDNLTSTGASDAGYVDGYVRKYGTGEFVFPVGDNGFVGQFAASADGTMGAYFHSDPTAAVTSNLFTGTNYPALPTGGPFPSATFEQALEAVSVLEYWDIDGTNATPITLTWDAGSNIAGLTSSQLEKLTIAGWDGTQWVAIPSVVQVTSILGGTSDLTAGSIVTTAAIVPNIYTAYTFASRDTPLPVKLASFDVRKEGATALLTWSTTEETNSDHFEVQRSANGNSWDKVGIVKSGGESKTTLNYNFTDLNPLTGGPSEGKNLYRLRMVDKNGTFAYSRIRTVQFENAGYAVAYPNPTSDILFIQDFPKVSNVRIVDLNGKTVHQSNTIKNGEINVSRLVAGVHIVEISWLDGSKTSQKLLIRK